MLKVIIEEKMIDSEMVTNRCTGYEELKNSLSGLPMDKLVEVTGLVEDEVRLAARLYAISGASSIFYAMGITQHVFGTDNVISLANLALISGKVGNGATGINPLRGQNNVQGATDMGHCRAFSRVTWILKARRQMIFFQKNGGLPFP